MWQRVESCWFCFAICLIRSPSPGSGLHRYTSERGKLGQILCRRYFGFRVILPGTYRFLSSESRYGMHYRLIQGGKLIQGTSCKLNTGIFLDQNTSRNLLDKPRRLDPNYKHPYTIYSPTSSFSCSSQIVRSPAKNSQNRILSWGPVQSYWRRLGSGWDFSVCRDCIRCSNRSLHCRLCSSWIWADSAGLSSEKIERQMWFYYCSERVQGCRVMANQKQVLKNQAGQSSFYLAAELIESRVDSLRNPMNRLRSAAGP